MVVTAETVATMTTTDMASVRHVLFRILVITVCVIGALLAAYVVTLSLLGMPQSLPELEWWGDYTPPTNELAKTVTTSGVFLLLGCTIVGAIYAVKRRPAAVATSLLTGIGLYIVATGMSVINIEPDAKQSYLADISWQAISALVAATILIAFVTTALPLTRVQKASVFRVNMSVLTLTLLFALAVAAMSAASHGLLTDEPGMADTKYLTMVVIISAVTLLATLGSALLPHRWTFTVFTIILFTGMTALGWLSVGQFPYGYGDTLLALVGVLGLIGMLFTLVPAIQADRYATT